MRLRRLELLRYGHLSDVVLEFPAQPPLHVVYGANEAGKSTALAAIADALFGFEHSTRFDFLHGAPELRIGFTLLAGDGAEATFVRRKGRGDTLRDPVGNSVSDDVLRRFLGAASRSLFEKAFGLNGEGLRKGGQELLQSGGEAGESLLAGSGLLNLREVLAKLDEEANALVGDARRRRRLSEAAEAWRCAQHERDDRAVSPEAWREAEKAHTRCETELAEVQQKIRDLSTEQSRLERVRRVAPVLAELTTKRELVRTLADVPRLPADTAARRQRAIAARNEAMHDANATTEKPGS